jgi:hypothetical protein
MPDGVPAFERLVRIGAAVLAHNQADEERLLHHIDARAILTAAHVPEMLDRLEALEKAARELADTFGEHNNGRLVLQLRAALATLDGGSL